MPKRDDSAPGEGFSYDPEVGPDWWTLAPTRFLRARGLAPTAKLLYLVLCSYAMEKSTAWPGQDRLALDCDVTRPTLRAALRQLMAVGLVEQRRRGQGRTNLYHLHKVPVDAVPPEGKNLAFSADGKNLAIKKASRLPAGPAESFPKQEAGKQETEQEDGGSIPAAASREPPLYSAYIAAVVLDDAKELGAASRGPDGVTTALAAWAVSGLDEAAFVGRLHMARAAVRKAQRPGVDKWGQYLAALRVET